MNLEARERLPVRDVRALLKGLEEVMLDIPGALVGNAFPLKHSFAHGLYVRQIFVPKGILLVSRIHKYSHASFLLQGEISIFGTEGISRLKAPQAIITPAGTKRAVYHHEDTVFCTVHATDKTDVAEIEEEVTVKSFEEVDDFIDVEHITELIRVMEGVS